MEDEVLRGRRGAELGYMYWLRVKVYGMGLAEYSNALLMSKSKFAQ